MKVEYGSLLFFSFGNVTFQPFLKLILGLFSGSLPWTRVHPPAAYHFMCLVNLDDFSFTIKHGPVTVNERIHIRPIVVARAHDDSGFCWHLMQDEGITN